MIKKISIYSFVIFFSQFLNAQKGFGFQYEQDIPNVIMVANVFKNSPAEKAGLQKDDLILSINGDEKVADYSNEDLKKLIKALPDKGNVFKISRNSTKLTLPIDKADFESFEYILLSGNGNSGKCTVGNYAGFKMEGPCKNGMVNGDGKFFDKTGKLLFEGGVRNNKRHGIGKEYVPVGRYEATFVNGEIQGKGRFYFKDGSYMEGTWIDSKREGVAQYFSADGMAGKTETYKGDKLVSTTNSTQNQASNTNSNLTKSQSYEQELQNVNAILGKDAGLIKTRVKISDGIIYTDDNFDKYEAKISDVGEIWIDDKNNEVVLLCKPGPYCVKQNKYVMKEGIIFADVKDFDKPDFAKRMQKILIGLGGNSVTRNSLKIITKRSVKKYEQELDKVINAMPEKSPMGEISLRIKNQALHYSDGMFAYSMNLRDMEKIVVDEKNKTVSLTCKKDDDCVASVIGMENKMNFKKFKDTDAAGFAKLLQNFVSSYDGF